MSTPVQRTSPVPGRTPWRLPQLRHRWAVPLITVLLVATLGKLLVLSPDVARGETAFLEGLSQSRNAALDALAMTMQAGFSNTAIVVVISVITGWLAVLKRRPLDGAAFLVMSVFGWAAIGLVKLSVERPRPSLGSGDQLVVLHGATSFPSAHTGGALAIVLALTLVNMRSAHRGRILLFGSGLVMVVGASRVYAGAHYLTDVLAALPVAWAGVMVGCSVANVLVPALAYGFGWKQRGVALGALAVARHAHGSTDVRATSSGAVHQVAFTDHDDVRHDRAA